MAKDLNLYHAIPSLDFPTVSFKSLIKQKLINIDYIECMFEVLKNEIANRLYVKFIEWSCSF